jgi:hypothetical protein
MPKIQAQRQTIECIHQMRPTPDTCLQQVIHPKHGCNLNELGLGVYTDVYKANLRQILLQNGVDIYNSDAKVLGNVKVRK